MRRGAVVSQKNLGEMRYGCVLIGTSGWHYDLWRGPFYPAASFEKKFELHTYASTDSIVRANGVFDRVPTPDAVSSWKEQTGREFVFTWKASKFITHWKRLSNSANSLELMEDRSVIAR